MTEKEFYEKHAHIQRGITLNRFRDLNKNILKGHNLFAGSSLAEQFPVNEMLQSRGLSHVVYNRGVSGDTIEGLIQDLETLVIDLEPSSLFINIGSNNIGGEDYNEDALFNKYTDLLTVIQERLPKCQIHVLSYYPVNPDKSSFLNEMAKKFMFANRTNTNIRRINSRLEKHCQNHGYSYINVHDILLDGQGQLHEDLTVEGIHLLPGAYEKVLDILGPYFT